MDQNPTPDLLSRLLDEAEGASPPAGGAETVTADTPSTPPISPAGGLLGGLAADPALLSSVLPALLSAMPQGGGGGASRGKPQALDRHTALLCAVKPYLGERRQATAETVLKICRLWDALARAGISPATLTGLLGGGASADNAEGEVD